MAFPKKVDMVNPTMLIVLVVEEAVVAVEREELATKVEKMSLDITEHPDVKVKKAKEEGEVEIAVEVETEIAMIMMHPDVEVVEVNAQELPTQMLKKVILLLI